MSSEATSGRLEHVSRVELPRHVVVQTQMALRNFGAAGNEGLVLWLGEVANGAAIVRAAMVPPQRSIRNEDGVGYFIDTGTLFEVNRFLSAKRLRLLAQVHSHPTEAYHSQTDDEYAIVTTEGGFSLVVPDFAIGPAVIDRWAIYRLRDRCWTRLKPLEVEGIFSVT